ncbi:MAG: hypothetical protein GY870_21700, partial [archaeon]|nr:hypothetical protein [archaeon]
MVITVDISPDKTILENGDKAIIFHSDPFRYDINTSYGVIKNIVTSINLSDCGMESKYKNSNISKKARKALKNLEIFTPKLFSSKSFNKENVKEEIISDSLGKGKLLNISLQFINPNFEGILFGKLIVKLYEHDIKKTNTSSITISVEINDWEKFKTNTSIHSISPLFLDEKGTWEVEKNCFPDSRAITFLKNGYQSWSISDLLYHNDKAGETPTSLGQMFGMHNYDKTIKCRFYSDMVGAITDLETQKSIIMGFISNENQYGQILMDRIEKSSFSFLMALCQFDFIKLENLKDKKVKSEELFVDLSSPMQGQLLLNDWALLTGIKMKSRILSLTENNIQINKEYNVLSGWCSWYYYYTKISEEKMVKNIDFLAKHTEFPIDIIQLDDGYQTEVGDFTSINEKFPNGLKWLVDKIHISHGMAGLWIAPFFAQDKSMLFKEHPEWFLKDKNGELVKTGRNWGSYLYALDLSMEVVIDHIKSLIKTIINEWGFDFIKIDFIYASEDIKVIYNDSSLTRAQILRRGVQAIRDSMGDKILLGCGAPLGPCIGLVDVMRIGCDTAANWIAAGSLGKFVHNKIKVEIPALKPALVATVMRSYMHNSLWFNDPDCCVVREKNSKLSLNEIKLQLTIFGLSGGQVFFSDDLKLLDEERLKYMNLIIPPY